MSATDPKKFEGIAGSSEFSFFLVPTVPAELDHLQVFARDPDFREKVAKTIRRIKGWRKQGRLNAGVTLNKTITVRALAREPNVRATLSWLDPENSDDRVIASVLEVQVLSPSSYVVLVTSDINLQNKAEAARLPCVEPP